jgi:hypothetical protein
VIRWHLGELFLAGGDDIRFLEILALEKQRVAGGLGQGIGEAVTEIQACRMAALAKVNKCLAGYACLLGTESLAARGESS